MTLGCTVTSPTRGASLSQSLCPGWRDQCTSALPNTSVLPNGAVHPAWALQGAGSLQKAGHATLATGWDRVEGQGT